MSHSGKTGRTTVNILGKCTMYERKHFKWLCEEKGISMQKGINLLIRQALKSESLPMNFNYESPDKLFGVVQVPDYGDIYEINDFIEMVKRHFIISSDGTGYLSDGKHIYYDVEIEVNIDWLLDFAPYYTHVCWFNK